MAYYTELKTKAKPEVMNFPIIHLGLKPYTLFTLNRLTVKPKTIGDLISIERSALRECLLIKNPNYAEINDIMKDIDECLAAVGVKMRCSNFSVYDVSTKRLGANVYSAIIKRWPDAVTIGDVTIIGNKKLRTLPVEIYNQLVDRLDRYGIKIEGSGHVILKSKLFKLPDIPQPSPQIAEPLPQLDLIEPKVEEKAIETNEASSSSVPASVTVEKLPRSPTAEQISLHNQKLAELISPDFYHKKLRTIKFKRSALSSIHKYAFDLDVCDFLNLTKTELRKLMHDNTAVVNYLKNYFESRGFIFKKIYKRSEKMDEQEESLNSDEKFGSAERIELGAERPISSTEKSNNLDSVEHPKSEPATVEQGTLGEALNEREIKIIKNQQPFQNSLNISNVTPSDLEKLPASAKEEFKQKLAISINTLGVGSLYNLDPQWFAPNSEYFTYIDSLVSWYFSSKIERKLPSTLMTKRESVKKQITEEIEFYDKLVRIKQKKLSSQSPTASPEILGSTKKQNLFDILNKFKRDQNASGIVIPVRVKKYNPYKNMSNEHLFPDEIDIGYQL